MKWIVTLDITVDAESREDAFDKVDALLRSAESYCLYDAEAAEQITAPDAAGGSVQPLGHKAKEINSDVLREKVGYRRNAV